MTFPYVGCQIKTSYLIFDNKTILPDRMYSRIKVIVNKKNLKKLKEITEVRPLG